MTADIHHSQRMLAGLDLPLAFKLGPPSLWDEKAELPVLINFYYRP
jgi:hypothetical protein